MLFFTATNVFPAVITFFQVTSPRLLAMPCLAKPEKKTRDESMVVGICVIVNFYGKSKKKGHLGTFTGETERLIGAGRHIYIRWRREEKHPG